MSHHGGYKAMRGYNIGSVRVDQTFARPRSHIYPPIIINGSSCKYPDLINIDLGSATGIFHSRPAMLHQKPDLRIDYVRFFVCKTKKSRVEKLFPLKDTHGLYIVRVINQVLRNASC